MMDTLKKMIKMDIFGLEFSKMHGLGNDHVAINEFKREIISET